MSTVDPSERGTPLSYSSFSYPSTGVRRRNSRIARVAAGVLIGVVAGNLVGYGAHKLVSISREPEAKPAPPNDALTRAHRLAGLEAMERGDYSGALRELSAALRAPNPARDLPQLLTIAQNLLEREQAKKAAAEAEAARIAEAQEERREDKAKAPPVPRPVKEVPAPLILVTTTPARLTIRVDGRLRDMTPARLEVEPGVHEVAIYEGKRALYRRRVRVGPGQVVSVNQDLTDRVRPEPEDRPPAPDKPPPGSKKTEADSEPPTSAPAGEATDPVDAGPVDGATQSDGRPAVAAAPAPPAPAPQPAQAPAVRPASPGPGGVKTIPRSTVRRVVMRSLSRFRACYDTELAERPDLVGAVTLRMVVDEDGRVVDGSVPRTTLSSRRANFCIDRAIDRLTFPPRPKGGRTVVQFKLTFRPDG